MTRKPHLILFALLSYWSSITIDPPHTISHSLSLSVTASVSLFFPDCLLLIVLPPPPPNRSLLRQ